MRALFEQDLGMRQASAERALTHPDPWEGFVDFLTEMGADLAENRGLQEVIMLGSHSSEPMETVRGGMLPSLRH